MHDADVDVDVVWMSRAEPSRGRLNEERREEKRRGLRQTHIQRGESFTHTHTHIVQHIFILYSNHRIEFHPILSSPHPIPSHSILLPFRHVDESSHLHATTAEYN